MTPQQMQENPSMYLSFLAVIGDPLAPLKAQFNMASKALEDESARPTLDKLIDIYDRSLRGFVAGVTDELLQTVKAFFEEAAPKQPAISRIDHLREIKSSIVRPPASSSATAAGDAPRIAAE